MKLHKLTIKNFRGIRELEWELHENMACLVGPGDSRKSTILLALEYLFWPSSNLAISEVDFYLRKTDTPVEISAIITDLPKKLMDDDKFGLSFGFYNPDKKHSTTMTAYKKNVSKPYAFACPSKMISSRSGKFYKTRDLR